MEIKNYINAVHAYSTVASGKSRSEKASESSSAKNMDKVEFSSAKLSSSDNVKATVAKAVESDASAERIAALSSLVSDGQYNISAESIIKAMLE